MSETEVGKAGDVKSALAAASMEDLVRETLKRIGEDPDREGLVGTPERVARSMAFLTKGYAQTCEGAIGNGIFEERHHNMVLVKDIEMYSMCEHHMLPFFGRVHVAYIPDGKIVGLSKTARIVEVYSRRLQVQERLTEQIAEALWSHLQPLGVGVVTEAYHLCMMMRGVQKQSSKTITSAMRGTFLTDPSTREEFLRLSTTPNGPMGR